MFTDVAEVEVIEILDLTILREHSHEASDEVALDVVLLSEVTAFNLHPLVADLFDLRPDLDRLAFVEQGFAVGLVPRVKSHAFVLQTEPFDVRISTLLPLFVNDQMIDLAPVEFDLRSDRGHNLRL